MELTTILAAIVLFPLAMTVIIVAVLSLIALIFWIFEDSERLMMVLGVSCLIYIFLIK